MLSTPAKKETPIEPGLMRFIGEGLASGAISIADLPQDIASLVNIGLGKAGLPVPDIELPRPSGYIKKGLKHIGVNLDTEAKTPSQRIAKHGAEFAGSFIGGGGLGAGLKALGAVRHVPALATAGKFLGAPKNALDLAKMGSLGAAIGSTSGAAQEVGISPLAADIGATFLTPAGISAAKHGLKKAGHYGMTAVSPKYREATQRSAAQKEASEYLRGMVGEKNIPEVLENLSAAEAPTVPLVGYEGTTAEKARNVGLSQLERAKQGQIGGIAEQRAIDNEAIRRALEEMAPTEHGIFSTKEHLGEIERGLESEAHKATGEIAHRVKPEEAGQHIRKTVSEKLGHHEAERAAATAPLYEKVESLKKGIKPLESQSLIDKKLEVARPNSALSNNLIKVRKMLTANVKGAPTEVEIKEMIKSGEYKKFGGEKLTLPGSTYPLPKELDETIKEVSDMIGKARSMGANSRAKALSEVKDALLKDLEVVPEIKEARAAYHEYSKPISEIEEHRTIGQIVARDKFNKEYTVGAAEIPDKIINSSMKSLKDSKDLLTQIGHDKDTMRAVEGYINNEILSEVTDVLGNVDVNKLEKWRQQNEGAFKIYPHLSTKLKNLQNAQSFVNHAKVKNMKESDSYFKGAFKAFSGEDPTRYVKNLLQGEHRAEKVREAVKLSKKNGSDSALEGLRRGFVEDIKDSIGLASIDAKGMNNISYNKFKQYMKSNEKALREVFDENQVSVLKQIEKSLEKRAFSETVGRAVDSSTSPNISILRALEEIPSGIFRKTVGKIVGVGPVLDFLHKYQNKIKIDAKNELINRALTDTETAKMLLTPLNEKSFSQKMKEYMNDRSYLLTPIISSKEEENE
jgi:hypothetical protein